MRAPRLISGNHPYTHQLASCGSLCRIVAYGKHGQVDVQIARGYLLQVPRADLRSLNEFNGLPLQQVGLVAA